MEMASRWDRLIEALDELVNRLKKYNLHRPQDDSAGEAVIEAVCDTCRDRLEAVLLPTDDHFRIDRRVANARNYHLDGQTNAAVYEAGWGLRLTQTLRAANGY
jgi:hypothetical protein